MKAMTKKRFYIEKISGSVWLRDGKGYVVVALPDNLQRSRIPYLEELCDLLNKGHEASTEIETLRRALKEIANWCTIERNCDDADIAASSMQLIAREALEATEEER